MGVQIASLFAKVGADTGPFDRAMSGVDSKLGAVGGAFGKLGGAIKAGVTVAAGAAAAGVAALGATIVKTTGAAADMEQQVANIAAMMNLTGEQTGQVKDLISNLGLDPKLKVSAVEAGQAIEMLGKNGLTITEILDGAARSTVLLANSTGADFATAADIATSAMSAFNIDAKDMAGAVNGINAVTVASKFGIEDYGLALAQAGGVASSVGVSFDDFNATIAAISPLFQSGSDAGTSFKTFLQRLIPQSKDARSQMKDLGLITTNWGKASEYLSKQLGRKVEPAAQDVIAAYEELATTQGGLEKGSKKLSKAIAGFVKSWDENQFYDANGQMKDMVDIVGLLNSATEDLSEEQKNEAFSTMFGTDAMRAAFAMANMTAEQFRELQTTLGQSNAEEAAAKRMDTFSGSMEILSGLIETLSIGIGDKFLPMGKQLATWAINLAQTYGPAVIDWFGALAHEMQYAINIITMSENPLQDLAKLFSIWAGDIWVLTKPKLVEAYASMVAWMTDPARASEAGAMLSTAWTFVQDWAGSLWAVLSPILSAFWGRVVSWVSAPETHAAVFTAMSTAWTFVQDWAGRLYGWAAPKLLAFWTGITSWVADPTKRAQLLAMLSDKWNQFSLWAGNIWATISPKLAELWDQHLKPWLDEKAGGLGTSLEGWGQKFTDFVEGTKTTWGKAWPEVNKIITDAADSITEDVERMMTSLGKLGALFSSEGDGKGWVINWAKLWVTVVDIIATAETKLIDSAANLIETFSIIGRGFAALSSGDWSQMDSLNKELNQVVKNMAEQNLHQFDWIQRMIESGIIGKRASGGPVTAGQPYMVGERGAETFVPASDGYILPNGAGVVNGRIDLYVHGDSNLPTNRQAIRELALALKREIDLTGAVMAR